MRKAVVTCLLFLVLGFWHGTPACAKVEAWHIEQESSANGKYDLLVSKSGVKLTSHAFGYVIYSKAPSWDLVVCRPASKELETTTLADWKKFRTPTFTMAGDAQSLPPPLSSQRMQRNGQPMIKYLFPGTGEVATFWASAEKKRFVNGFELVSFDLPLPKEASAVIYKIYNLPALSGCPEVLVNKSTEGRGWMLRTTTFGKTELPDDSAFAPPSYKNAGKLTQGFMIKGAQRNLEGMSDLLRE